MLAQPYRGPLVAAMSPPQYGSLFKYLPLKMYTNHRAAATDERCWLRKIDSNRCTREVLHQFAALNTVFGGHIRAKIEDGLLLVW